MGSGANCARIRRFKKFNSPSEWSWFLWLEAQVFSFRLLRFHPPTVSAPSAKRLASLLTFWKIRSDNLADSPRWTDKLRWFTVSVFSTYAGNPYLIDLDTLCEEGLLTKEEVMSRDWGSDDAEVDYEKIYNNRFEVLKIAYDNFKRVTRRHLHPSSVKQFMAQKLCTLYGS